MGAIGHVVSGFFTLVILAGLGAILADGRSLIRADTEPADKVYYNAVQKDEFYGIGIATDSNGRQWDNERHFVETRGCDDHKKLGRTAAGFTYMALICAAFTMLFNLYGAQSGKGFAGLASAVLSLLIAVFTLIAFSIAAAFCDKRYTCNFPNCPTTPEPTSPPTNAPALLCDPFVCPAGFTGKQDKATTECLATGCTSATCCDQVRCDSHRCGPNFGGPRANNATLVCPTTGCTDNVCCEPLCKSFVCASVAGYTDKAMTTGETPCAAAGCLTTCCTQVTCASFNCTGAAHPKTNVLNCGGMGQPACDAATCCTIDVCSSHTCGAMAGSLTWDSETKVCLAAGCNDATCCAKDACVEFSNTNAAQYVTCPIRHRDHQNITTRVCDRSVTPITPCDQAACCEPTVYCSTFTCSDNFVSKAGVADLECSQSGGCDEATCCDKKVFCDVFLCPAADALANKANAATIQCGIRAFECTAAKCCDAVVPQQVCHEELRFMDHAHIGYALPVLVVACVLALISVAAVVATGGTKDEGAEDAAEEEEADLVKETEPAAEEA